MNPLLRYEAALAAHELLPDVFQKTIVILLEQLHYDCVNWKPPSSRLLTRLPGQNVTLEPVRGIYLWGGVGRGKTLLMDMFYDTLPFEKKLRLHFHRFMQLVHEHLNDLDGHSNPLPEVARRFAERARVICLDEMHINDITDAMLIGGFLESLFHSGVTMVITSNVPPSSLYIDGLKRNRFLPAIALMERHLSVTSLDSKTDYRLRALRDAEVYHYPLDDSAFSILEASYRALVPIDHPKPNHVVINQRQIPVVGWADGVVWFDFDLLCDTPRSKLDYVELAKYFHTVLLQNLRVLNDRKADHARRLIDLVDILYDANVKLFIAAEASPKHLYRGKRVAFEFQRTVSRLIEMQSQEYLARPHCPDIVISMNRY
jgi:cell division protein ZapE